MRNDGLRSDGPRRRSDGPPDGPRRRPDGLEASSASVRLPDGTTKDMSLDELRDQFAYEDGKATRREEGSATLAVLEATNPQLARRAKLAQVVADRLGTILPGGGDDLRLLSASNWPFGLGRRRRPPKARKFRIAPPTETERLVVTVQRGEAKEETYAVRATRCGRALALRAAWRYDRDAGTRGAEKLLPGHDPRWPLLLTATAIRASAAARSLVVREALLLLLLPIFLLFCCPRRRRRLRRPTPSRSESIASKDD
mmetsp:Transcript_12760/g.41743  ORF Transcript_12760/g.41743 Transcript_12760/m.41743 type:complete len:256 (+) Transcript_12760:40-807(+)